MSKLPHYSQAHVPNVPSIVDPPGENFSIAQGLVVYTPEELRRLFPPLTPEYRAHILRCVKGELYKTGGKG